jgi:hypothetical protein
MLLLVPIATYRAKALETVSLAIAGVSLLLVLVSATGGVGETGSAHAYASMAAPKKTHRFIKTS